MTLILIKCFLSKFITGWSWKNIVLFLNTIGDFRWFLRTKKSNVLFSVLDDCFLQKYCIKSAFLDFTLLIYLLKYSPNWTLGQEKEACFCVRKTTAVYLAMESGKRTDRVFLNQFKVSSWYKRLGSMFILCRKVLSWLRHAQVFVVDKPRRFG